MSNILVNIIKDTGNNTLLSSDGSGSVTASSSLASSVQSVGGLQNTPAFHVHQTSNQSLSANTLTVLNNLSEKLDTDNGFGSNKFTVPTGKGGWYFLAVTVGMENQTSGLHAGIQVNGNYVVSASEQLINNQNTANSLGFMFSRLVNLSAGDEVRPIVYVVSSGISTNSGRTAFSGFRMIGV